MTRLCLYLCFSTLIFVQCLQAEGRECRISLLELSSSRVSPGDEVELIGNFGIEQGTKVVALNRGTVNKLEIIEWGGERVKVKIPSSIEIGAYKLGIYCQDPEVSRASSGFRNLFIQSNPDS